MDLRNWWDQVVVSRIIEYGCALESAVKIREEIIPLASGDVFELGCGAGANQPFYDHAKVTSFCGLEPSSKLLDLARSAAGSNGWAADIKSGVGEAIPFKDESFDTVVCTFTLCSVTDHDRSLAELRRILRPGGRLLYAEHGRAPDVSVYKWQKRIEPAWRRILGNCHITREVTAAIEKAGFVATPLATRYHGPGPRIASWMEWGVATKGA